uniref:Uncharacterized protein n=1 Tax=Leersia perrieri TaxID=77586 RepID=A0A0D9V193_9ORYZ
MALVTTRAITRRRERRLNDDREWLGRRRPTGGSGAVVQLVDRGHQRQPTQAFRLFPSPPPPSFAGESSAEIQPWCQRDKITCGEVGSVGASPLLAMLQNHCHQNLELCRYRVHNLHRSGRYCYCRYGVWFQLHYDLQLMIVQTPAYKRRAIGAPQPLANQMS